MDAVSRVHIVFGEHGEVVEYQVLPLRRQRLNMLRQAAAISLGPRFEVAEALLAGVPVPARRLDPTWADALSLTGDVVLDLELALRVSGHGPIGATA
jgi:hypothetical protein